MTGFDFWVTLLSGILILLGGLNGIVSDIKKKSAWWKWALDILSVPCGIWLLVALLA